MERKKLQQILLKMYSKDSVKSIMMGRMKPSYENMIILYKQYNIAFTAWEDIKAYLGENKKQEAVAS